MLSGTQMFLYTVMVCKAIPTETIITHSILNYLLERSLSPLHAEPGGRMETSHREDSYQGGKLGALSSVGECECP